MRIIKISLFSLFFINTGAFGTTGTFPDCPLAVTVNNAQVLQWKRSTPNSFHARGHIQGTIRQAYPDQTGHHHAQVEISAGGQSDTIEIVFNEDFGKTPPLRGGQQVEACGDYITSNKNVGRMQASRDGAIVHWLHLSPDPQRHPSGYLAIDGQVYGQQQ